MWHYSLSNNAHGPVGEEELIRLIQWGVVTEESMLWKAGMAKWTPLRETAMAWQCPVGEPARPVVPIAELAPAFVAAGAVPGGTGEAMAERSQAWGSGPAPVSGKTAALSRYDVPRAHTAGILPQPMPAAHPFPSADAAAPAPVAVPVAAVAPIPAWVPGASLVPTAVPVPAPAVVGPALPAVLADSPFARTVSPPAGQPLAAAGVAVAPLPGSNPFAPRTPQAGALPLAGGHAPLIDRALPPPTPSANYYGGTPARETQPADGISQPGEPAPAYGTRVASSNAYAPPRSKVQMSYAAPDKPLTLRQILFSFKGRIPRRQYWGVSLGMMAGMYGVGMVAEMLSAVLEKSSGGGDMAHRLQSAIVLLTLPPMIWSSFAVTVKRWQDRGKSSIMLGLMFVPLIGALWTLIELGFLRGTQGRNKYGSDPT